MSKGGKPTKHEETLLSIRKKLVEKLVADKFTKAEIARIFNVHQAQITRILR